MTEEIRPPQEGMSTLGAQFTQAAVQKILRVVRSLREQGWRERKILDQMKRDLPSFPSHTLRRLYDQAIGNPVEDDFRPEEVVAEREVKARTLEVELRNPPKGIGADCLVRYRGSDWYVAQVSGKTFRLKRLG